MTEITRLQKHQIRQAGETIAQAFMQDPLTPYLFPREANRLTPLTWFMTRCVKYGQLYGEAYATDDMEGAAVWLKPGQTVMTPSRMLRAGYLAAPLRIGLGSFLRLMNAMNHLEELHKRDMPPGHWYLFLMGVIPARQRQGLGGELIAPVLARADAEGLPCYLETGTEINVAFYKKHGFEVLAEGALPKGGPHFWTMRRGPQTKSEQ
jgi:ribosomal protein S18 acetylase RimI-like enzyme